MTKIWMAFRHIQSTRNVINFFYFIAVNRDVDIKTGIKKNSERISLHIWLGFALRVLHETKNIKNANDKIGKMQLFLTWISFLIRLYSVMDFYDIWCIKRNSSLNICKSSTNHVHESRAEVSADTSEKRFKINSYQLYIQELSMNFHRSICNHATTEKNLACIYIFHSDKNAKTRWEIAIYINFLTFTFSTHASH